MLRVSRTSGSLTSSMLEPFILPIDYRDRPIRGQKIDLEEPSHQGNQEGLGLILIRRS